MQGRILAALFPLILLCAIAARAEEWTKTFPLTGRPHVRVETTDGNVSVHTWDRQEISARVETMGRRIADNEVRVEARQSGDRLDLEVRVPRRWNFSWGGNRRWVHIELTIPREAVLAVQTGDGHITLAGVKGEIRLRSGDGHINASGLDGRLDASSGDGHIEVEGRFDLLDLHTGDGHIDARALAGSRMAGNWTLRTGDGKVTLRLPEGFSAELDAHTNDGHISLSFPVTVSGSISTSSIRGKMNAGGPTLTVRTGDGSIRVERL